MYESDDLTDYREKVKHKTNMHLLESYSHIVKKHYYTREESAKLGILRLEMLKRMSHYRTSL